MEGVCFVCVDYFYFCINGSSKFIVKCLDVKCWKLEFKRFVKNWYIRV